MFNLAEELPSQTTLRTEACVKSNFAEELIFILESSILPAKNIFAELDAEMLSFDAST